MTNDSIFDKVVELVRNNFPVTGHLSAELHTDQIEGWDSFGTMRMVMDIEEAFAIEIPITVIPELDTLGKIAEFIASQVRTGATA